MSSVAILTALLLAAELDCGATKEVAPPSKIPAPKTQRVPLDRIADLAASACGRRAGTTKDLGFWGHGTGAGPMIATGA